MDKERIVHLDFKGAPLKVPYLERVITAAQSYGATGILIEWEDTFPYSRELSEIGSNGTSNTEGLYSLDQVKQILRTYNDKRFKVIQLVQTIGHMEFVLKHPSFRDLREHSLSPAVLCPSKKKSQMLVRLMIDQVLELQPDAEYLHIGADEVWHIATCPDCQRRASAGGFSQSDLILAHIHDVALYVKYQRPDITVLVWDDMLRNVSANRLRDYNLHSLVRPVVWDYNVQERFSINPNLWCSYKQVFPAVWAGSAFKGANGSCQIISPVARYVSNQKAWLAEMAKVEPEVRFEGVILTGWSRYDHYATLCELMPVSMSCLAACLKILKSNQSHYDGSDSAMAETEVISSDEWPFQELAQTIRNFANVSEECKAYLRSDAISTWLNPWQIEREFTNPLQLDGITRTTQELLSNLKAVRAVIYMQLKSVIGRRSCEEWLGTFVTPLLNELDKLYQIANERNSVEASVMPVKTLSK